MFTEDFKNWVITQVNNALNKVKVGSGTTTELESDTDLESAYANEFTPTKTTFNKGFSWSIVIPSGTLDGDSISEVGDYTSSDVLISRMTFYPFSKTSNDELTIVDSASIE